MMLNFTQQPRSNWMRLRTLTQLRWMTVIGQTIALYVSVFILHIDLPIIACIIAILTAALVNFVCLYLMSTIRRLSEKTARLSLLFDLLQLTILLFLAGGLNNPFSILILVPITISATFLSLYSTFIIGSVGLFFATVLLFVHIPLHILSSDGSMALLEIEPILLWGMWTALFVTVIFMASYARQVAEETFLMSQALSATQMALEREQKLTALGGVVAAAAHEMGTPLATIQLAAQEMLEELEESNPIREDAALIHSQASRLSRILHDMGASMADDTHVAYVPFAALLETAAEPHIDRGKKVIFTFNDALHYKGQRDMPVIAHAPEIIHGLRNLIQNAVDFADENVWIESLWDDTLLTITISDDGPGFPPHLVEHIGEPYLNRDVGTQILQRQRPAYQGMGMGLFIADTLLKRSKAHVSFSNVTAKDKDKSSSGAKVIVSWPRDALEKISDESGKV